MSHVKKISVSLIRAPRDGVGNRQCAMSKKLFTCTVCNKANNKKISISFSLWPCIYLSNSNEIGKWCKITTKSRTYFIRDNNKYKNKMWSQDNAYFIPSTTYLSTQSQLLMFRIKIIMLRTGCCKDLTDPVMSGKYFTKILVYYL